MSIASHNQALLKPQTMDPSSLTRSQGSQVKRATSGSHGAHLLSLSLDNYLWAGLFLKKPTAWQGKFPLSSSSGQVVTGNPDSPPCHVAGDQPGQSAMRRIQEAPKSARLKDDTHCALGDRDDEEGGTCRSCAPCCRQGSVGNQWWILNRAWGPPGHWEQGYREHLGKEGRVTEYKDS